MLAVCVPLTSTVSFRQWPELGVWSAKWSFGVTIYAVKTDWCRGNQLCANDRRASTGCVSGPIVSLPAVFVSSRIFLKGGSLTVSLA